MPKCLVNENDGKVITKVYGQLNRRLGYNEELMETDLPTDIVNLPEKKPGGTVRKQEQQQTKITLLQKP